LNLLSLFGGYGVNISVQTLVMLHISHVYTTIESTVLATLLPVKKNTLQQQQQQSL